MGISQAEKGRLITEMLKHRKSSPVTTGYSQLTSDHRAGGAPKEQGVGRGVLSRPSTEGS